MIKEIKLNNEMYSKVCSGNLKACELVKFILTETDKAFTNKPIEETAIKDIIINNHKVIDAKINMENRSIILTLADKEIYLEEINFNAYNVQLTKIIKPVINIKFDFNNNTITINNKAKKVERDNVYTYKILKTKIKAVNGIIGLYNHITQSILDNTFNGSVYKSLELIGA